MKQRLDQIELESNTPSELVQNYFFNPAPQQRVMLYEGSDALSVGALVNLLKQWSVWCGGPVCTSQPP